jgi:hypothetical protein
MGFGFDAFAAAGAGVCAASGSAALPTKAAATKKQVK